MNNLYQEIINSPNSSNIIYSIEINLNMHILNIYINKFSVYEQTIMSWSNSRLSVHSLAIETGLWNQPGP